MNRITRRTALGLSVVLLASQMLAASKAESIDALVRRYNELRQFNGSVLVADASGIVHKGGYGHANFEWQIPNTPDVRFRLASVTKQFTSMVVLQLVAEGKIKLDDHITMHLPDYRKDTGARITIAQLLNHTSGIPSYTSLPGFMVNDSRDPYAVGEFVKKYSSGDLEFEPGTQYAYNNSAYFILGAIIEKVTGKTYAQAVQERIFDPLGMKGSGYDLPAPIIPKRASGYVVMGDTYQHAPYLDMSIPYAAGSLYSTVEDLYLWDRALYTDKLLRDDLKKQMFTPGLEHYGFGWAIGALELDDGSKVASVSHNGGIHGFSTRLLRIPKRKELVVLLDNTSSGGKVDDLAASIVSILHGVEPKQPRKSLVAELRATAEESGEAIVARYRELRRQQPDAYDYREQELNTLGYQLLAQGRVPDAIEVFKLNVEMYPKAANPYDSLGEAYAVAGNRELAIVNYRKSFELDKKNTNARDAIVRLQKPPVAAEAKYPLDAFVGRYQLQPGFVLSFFVEGGKLLTQATGQPKLNLHAESATEFSIIGVAARVAFHMNPEGKATAVTLFQGGREMRAERVE